MYVLQAYPKDRDIGRSVGRSSNYHHHIKQTIRKNTYLEKYDQEIQETLSEDLESRPSTAGIVVCLFAEKETVCTAVQVCRGDGKYGFYPTPSGGGWVGGSWAHGGEWVPRCIGPGVVVGGTLVDGGG